MLLSSGFSFEFDDSISEFKNNFQLGILRANELKVSTQNTELWLAINADLDSIVRDLEVAQISKKPNLFNSRKAYKNLGKDPSRYRLSAEAMLRRLVKGKGLYQINNLVDLLNWVSIKTAYSIGGFDASKIQGSTIRLSKGVSSDKYDAIGRGILNIENLPCLRDKVGAFGTPTSDSNRTSVSENCEDFLMVFYSFYEHNDLESSLSLAENLLIKYAGAKPKAIYKQIISFN